MTEKWLHSTILGEKDRKSVRGQDGVSYANNMDVGSHKGEGMDF